MRSEKKIAQEMGFLPRNIEKLQDLNPINKAFKPSVQSINELTREVKRRDDTARKHAKNLKDHLSDARTSFKRKRYIDSVIHIRNFYSLCKTVLYILRQSELKILELKAEISKDVLYKDHSKDDLLRRVIYCSRCNGSGKRQSGDKCPSCDGTGKQVRYLKKNNNKPAEKSNESAKKPSKPAKKPSKPAKKPSKPKNKSHSASKNYDEDDDFLREFDEEDYRGDQYYYDEDYALDAAASNLIPAFQAMDPIRFRITDTSNNIIRKEALISDFINNLFDKKSRSVSLWEKYFPKESEKIKNNIEDLVETSGSFLDFLMSSFEELADARVGTSGNILDYLSSIFSPSSNIEEYLSTLKNIRKKFWEDYSPKYFKCIQAVFSDDISFIYNYIGFGQNKVNDIKSQVAQDLKEGPDVEPNQNVINSTDNSTAQVEQEDTDDSENNNSSPTTDENAETSADAESRQPYAQKNKDKKQNDIVNNKNNVIPFASHNKLEQKNKDENEDHKRSQMQLSNRNEDDRINLANMVRRRSQNEIEVLNNSIEIDMENINKLENRIKEISFLQERLPDDILKKTNDYWPGKFDVSSGMNGLKNLIKGKKLQNKKSKDRQTDLWIQEIETLIDLFERMNPEEIDKAQKKISGLNEIISDKKNQIDDMQRKIDNANTIISSLSGISAAAQRRWILTKIAKYS